MGYAGRLPLESPYFSPHLAGKAARFLNDQSDYLIRHPIVDTYVHLIEAIVVR